jgi:pyridoxal phosphate enzyme (YggS family)
VFDSVALGARLASVRDRIARAAGRARRDPAFIRLVAVSKTFPLEYVRAAADAGQTDFGENKVQEAQQKIDAATAMPLRWHLIGHLQSNKARKASASFDVIHAIDGVDLLRRVDEGATAAGRVVDVLIQVDLAREPTKHGAEPAALPAIIAHAAACRAVRLTGLMLLPPAVEDPEQARRYFRTLRELRDSLVAQGTDPVLLQELSMGMSQDFEVAIEEGATIVRVGTAIFGARPAKVA